MDAVASANRSSSGPCLARNRARSGMPIAYAGHFEGSTSPVEYPLHPFGGEDAGDAREVIGYDYIRPSGGVQERLNGGQAVVPEFENQDATELEKRGGLHDKTGVEFVALFAAV